MTSDLLWANVKRHLPAIGLVALGTSVALMLTPEWAGAYAEPPSSQMVGIDIALVDEPGIVGAARGFLDGSVAVPGGTLFYGWVVWANPEGPRLLTTSADLGPGVAYDRPDVLAAIGSSGQRSGFQVLLREESSSPPCLLIEGSDGNLVIPGAESGC